MAIQYPITLSATEPNNNVGILKIRQADEETQTLVVNITANGQPKSYEGLQPFFCAKLGQSLGLGIIEQKLNPEEMIDPKSGQLEYTFRNEDWQQIGRQVGYFSFRKMSDEHEYVEQFTTRDFYFNVTKNVFSDGIKEARKDGSTYVWTIEDIVRLFKEYMATGKIEWENYKNDERTIWETYRLAEKINWDDYKLREKNEWQNYKADEKTTWEKFIEDNREFLENADPGGKIILELLGARNGAESLGERLDEEKAEVTAQLAQKADQAEVTAQLAQKADQAEVTAQLAQIVQDESITVTVGAGGDYATVNEAITALSQKKLKYSNTGFNATIKLLTGFVMAEQIFVKDIDLGFITITSTDAEVIVNATGFVNNVNELGYGAIGLTLTTGAVITGYGNAVLPVIDVLFNLNNSGTPGRTVGLVLIYGATGRIARGKGFINGISGGVAIYEGSRLYATDTIIRDNAGNNIACYRGSYVLFRGGKANGSVSGYGVYLDNLCQMDAAMADFSGNNKSNVWLSGQSLLSANSAKFNRSMTGNGLNVDGASVADVHNSEFNNNAQNGIYAVKSSLVDANACQSQNNTQIGLFVSSTANVNASDAVIKNNGTYGVRCNFGGFLNVSRANCQKVEGTNGADIRVDYNGYIVAQNAIGGLSGVTQGNVINQNGLILNNDPIPEDLGTLGANIQSRVVFSQIKNNSCASSMIPLSKTAKKTIVIKTVAIHESGRLSADEIALLSVEKYLDGFCLTTKNSELSAKLSNASAKIYFDAIKTV